MLIRQIVASAILALSIGFVLAHAPVVFVVGMVLWIVFAAAAGPVIGRWLRHCANLDQGGNRFHKWTA